MGSLVASALADEGMGLWGAGGERGSAKRPGVWHSMGRGRGQCGQTVVSALDVAMWLEGRWACAEAVFGV